MPAGLRDKISTAAFAFRGYNVENLGRTPELLAHPAYGPIVEEVFIEAQAICSDALGERVDLLDRVRRQEASTLESFGSDIALICAAELAQIRLLEQFFDIPYKRAKLVFGYSLGEVTALIAGGVYTMADILPAPLSMANDCIDLARDVTMGVLFSRGPALDMTAVERLCLQINTEGEGIIAISSVLSPNTVLLLGQRETLDKFTARMGEALPGKTHMRKNTHRWPPLHTPILWQRNIPNRAAVFQHTMGGGFTAPTPPVLSCVTGKASYTDHNSRDLLNKWIDHPQKLWDVVYETLASGVETVIHVGPAPNLIPATFKRLSDNVAAQLKRRSLNSLGLRAMSGMIRRPWLTKLISSRAALLRAPFVDHVILEDWLLDQELP